MMRAFVLCAGLLALLGPAAQDVVPAPDLELIEGRVTDLEGAPLPAGLAVDARFELEPAPGLSRTTVLEVLRRVPVPPLRVAPDGRIAMAVTDLHRATLVPELGVWSYVVSAPGFHSWRQRLPQGVAGLLGLDATLAPERERQQVRVDVEPVERDRVVWVRHWLRVAPGGGPGLWESRSLVLPAQGTGFDVAVPEAPRPFDWGQQQVAEWGTSARILDLWTGRLQMYDLREQRGPARVRAVPQPQARQWSFESTAEPGRPLGDVRVLVKGPLDRLWVNLGSEGRLRLPKTFRPIAAWATGHRLLRVSAEGGVQSLEPADAARSLRIVVTRPRGARLAGVEVVVERLEPLLSDAALRVPLPRPLHRARTDDTGVVTLPASILAEPLYVRARAAGFQPQIAVDPRAVPGKPARSLLKLEPERPRDLTVRLVSDVGGAVARGLVAACGESSTDLLSVPLVGVTDMEGQTRLPAGASHEGLVAVGTGFLPSAMQVVPRIGGVHRMRLYPALRTLVQTVDDEGHAVPFTRLTLESVSQRDVVSDARGRLLIHHDPAARLAAIQPRVPRARTVIAATRSREAQGVLAMQEVRVDRLLPVRADGAELGRLARIEVLGDPQGAEFLRPVGFVRSGVILGRWRAAEGHQQFIALDTGPPLWMSQTSVDGVEPSPEGVVRMLDRRRRVPLVWDLLPREVNLDFDLSEARVEFLGANERSLISSTSMGNLLEIDADGRAHLVLAAADAVDLILLHPNCLPVRFEVPAAPAAGAEQPVEIRLEHTERISFELPVRRAGALDVEIVCSPQTPLAPSRIRDRLLITPADVQAGFKRYAVPHGRAAGPVRLVVHPAGADPSISDLVLGEDDLLIRLP